MAHSMQQSVLLSAHITIIKASSLAVEYPQQNSKSVITVQGEAEVEARGQSEWLLQLVASVVEEEGREAGFEEEAVPLALARSLTHNRLPAEYIAEMVGKHLQMLDYSSWERDILHI